MLAPNPQSPTPIVPQTSSNNTKRTLVLAAILIAAVLAISIPLIIRNRDQQNQPVTPLQQNTQTQAWATSQSAVASCGANGAEIKVSFTNNEPQFDRFCMKVTATDTQTNESISLGEINPGETKTAQLATKRSTINAGQVKFDLLWCDGHDGNAKDSRIANYSNITCQSQISQCRQIKIYNQENVMISASDMYIDDTITVAVGHSADGSTPTKARFSFDNGATWKETTTKNASGEFITTYKVPAQADIKIKAQIYTSTGTWN